MTAPHDISNPTGQPSGLFRDAGSRRIIGAAETDGRFALIEMTEATGGGPPCHQHDREDEALYVLAGDLAVWQAGLWSPAPAGTAVWLPRAREHAYVVTKGPARLLVFITPAGLEGFFAEISACSRGKCIDAELLVTIAARYGVEITGPGPLP